MVAKKQILKRIELAKERIGKERDRLRELVHDAESLADDCDEAIADLERAADALSRLV